MKFLSHSLIQIRVSISKDNSHRLLELFELGSGFRTGPDGWQQIFIQSEERGARARCGIELLIQQRHKLISDLSIPEESTDLPPVHATENKVIEHP